MAVRPHSDAALTLHRSGGMAGQDGWSYRLAYGLAYVVNPFILPPVLFAFLLMDRGAPLEEIGWAAVFGLVFFAVVPLGYIGWLQRRRRIASLEIPNHADRIRPFAVTVGSYGAALLLTYAAQPTAMPLLLAVIGCYVVNTTIATLITLRWKISIHAISIAGFVSILLFVAHLPAGTGAPIQERLRPETLYALLLLVPLLMWARVRTRAHTSGQVVAGAAFGLLLPFVELMALHEWGLF